MILDPADHAELIWLFEDQALSAEYSETESGPMVAECIRRQTPGLIEAITTVASTVPEYVAECICAMSAAQGVQLPEG